MEIDVIKLKSNLVSSVPVSFEYIFSDEQLKGTDLKSLNIKVNGEILLKSDDYQIMIDLKGKMVLPCSITLEPVEIPFSISIDQSFNEFMEESLENNKNVENKLDLFPIIWENILMEIPTKVISEKAKNIKLEGDGWKLITEEEKNANHAFEKLNDLLK